MFSIFFAIHFQKDPKSRPCEKPYCTALSRTWFIKIKALKIPGVASLNWNNSIVDE